MSAAASEALLAVPFTGEVNRARIGLGQPAISYRQLRRDLAEQRWPVLHGFSRHLVPRPADWRPGLEVVGSWWSEPDPTWAPSEDGRAPRGEGGRGGRRRGGRRGGRPAVSTTS